MAKKVSKKKPVATRKPRSGPSMRMASLEALSERVVAIPEVAVYSERPFALIGTIGGRPPISSSAVNDVTETGSRPVIKSDTKRPARAPAKTKRRT